jgi:hypothetical protein
MARILIGGVVAGIVYFFWGAVAHMTLPLGMMGFSSIPADREDSVRTVLKAAIQEPGLYFVPGGGMEKLSEDQQKVWLAKLKEGPSALLVVRPNGGEPMTPGQLLTELASNIVAGLLAAYLLAQVPGGYLARVRFTSLLGLFGWLIISVSYWNWYGFPVEFTVAGAIEEVVGWFLAGLALAAIVPYVPGKPDAWPTPG